MFHLEKGHLREVIYNLRRLYPFVQILTEGNKEDRAGLFSLVPRKRTG